MGQRAKTAENEGPRAAAGAFVVRNLSFLGEALCAAVLVAVGALRLVGVDQLVEFMAYAAARSLLPLQARGGSQPSVYPEARVGARTS